MIDHTETRKVLWNQNSIELFQAQELDGEIEKLEKLLLIKKEKALICRFRAAEFVKAAEELGKLDNG